MNDRETEDSLSRLQDEIRAIKLEVDGLQIDAARRVVPWYRNASTLIAASALVISLAFGLVNHYRNVGLDQYRLRGELASTILRLHSLPLKMAEFSEKFSESSFIQGGISSLFQAESAFLASRGVEIIEQIPELVSVNERIVIGDALWKSGEIARAVPLFEEAGKSAPHAGEAVAAYRALGAMWFDYGDIERGRKHLSDAAKIFETGRFPDNPPRYIASTNSHTYMYWAQREALIGECDEWDRHLRTAKEIHDPIGAEDLLSRQIAETNALGCPPGRQGLLNRFEAVPLR